jgi:hypothetical protein
MFRKEYEQDVAGNGCMGFCVDTETCGTKFSWLVLKRFCMDIAARTVIKILFL